MRFTTKAVHLALGGVWLLGLHQSFGAETFTATEPGQPGRSAAIVVATDAKTGREWDWAALQAEPARIAAKNSLFGAVSYLQEGVLRMTGMDLPVHSGSDFSKGIILTTLANASPEIQADEKIQQALRNSGEDAYNANEAYFVRSERERVLIVANTDQGLSHGVVALLESVGYEVLGMGPAWIHVPDFHAKPLTFSLEDEGRAGFYVRLLWPTTGQERGVGTLSRVTLHDPADEPVEESYQRWSVGTRQAGGSMPRVRGGHALGRYHQEVARAMRDQNVTEGFLLENVTVGPDAARPPAGDKTKDGFWINNDPKGTPCYDKVFLSDGKKWEERELRNRTVGASLDLSSALTREVILREMIKKAEESFSKDPEADFHFATDPEDGSPQYARIAALSADPEWYPRYLEGENLKFGPYALHGFKGLDQPEEIWDPNSPSDIIYGFNNWLLREFDKHVDSLPESERVTAAGKSKKAMVRCNLLSYNYHDVPPNFNLDPRIRIKIAGFPKHRGKGKWADFRTHADLARAYRILLPREPSVDYQIWSQAYFHDPAAGNITGSPSAATIQQLFKTEYEAGFRGFETETDFNFGKYGLKYYLAAKMLWNPLLTAEELDRLRDRWLQRAFGSAWPEMKAYYDYMVPDAAKPSSPQSWARAVRLLDAAGRKLEGSQEVDARRRIDDVKQFWYFYYLVESGKATGDSPSLREFVWKGQMSYMTAMYMVTKRFFQGGTKATKIAGSDLQKGPAHYNPEEIDAWWTKVLAFWPLKAIREFREQTLVDGTPGKSVDLNDLVRVREFQKQDGAALNIITYNRMPGTLLRKEPARFFTTALQPGDEIGFKLFWPATTNNGRRENSALQVPYGITKWNAESGAWEEVVDYTMALAPSIAVTKPDGSKWFLVEVRHPADQAGTYRVEVGNGDFESHLTSLDYDMENGSAADEAGHTYFSSFNISPVEPKMWYFYIPKGTRQLDLETSTEGRTALHLYHGLPDGEWRRERTVNIGERGAHNIELQDGEDGSVAAVQGDAFPHLYSLPMLCSKTPRALLVPRAVAAADGLTIIEKEDETSLVPQK